MDDRSTGDISDTGSQKAEIVDHLGPEDIQIFDDEEVLHDFHPT